MRVRGVLRRLALFHSEQRRVKSYDTLRSSGSLDRWNPDAGGAPMLGTFENAFTHAPIGMALIDLEGRLLRVNDALCRITGYTAELVGARSFRDLSDPLDVDVD